MAFVRGRPSEVRRQTEGVVQFHLWDKQKLKYVFHKIILVTSIIFRLAQREGDIVVE